MTSIQSCELHCVFSKSTLANQCVRVEPIVKKLAAGWERTFQTRFPKALTTFIAASGKSLHKFHAAVEARAREDGVGLASLSTLKTQINTYEMLFGDLNQSLIEELTTNQREANRDFAPTIKSVMHDAYEACTDEHGPGSFMRMKTAMSEHVKRNRYHMFGRATVTVQDHLYSMCRSLQKLMDTRAAEICVKIEADYTRALVGVPSDQAAAAFGEEKSLRSAIRKKLCTVDSQFEVIYREGVARAEDDAGGEVGEVGQIVTADNAASEPTHESSMECEATQDPVVQDSVMLDVDDSGVAGSSYKMDKLANLPTSCSNDVTDMEL